MHIPQSGGVLHGGGLRERCRAWLAKPRKATCLTTSACADVHEVVHCDVQYVLDKSLDRGGEGAVVESLDPASLDTVPRPPPPPPVPLQFHVKILERLPGERNSSRPRAVVAISCSLRFLPPSRVPPRRTATVCFRAGNQEFFLVRQTRQPAKRAGKSSRSPRLCGGAGEMCPFGPFGPFGL